MDISIVISVALGLLAGVVASLTIIAPKTQSKVDDKLLEHLKKVQEIVDGLKPKA